MIRLQRNPRTIPLRAGDKNKFWSHAHLPVCHWLCSLLPGVSFSCSFLLKDSRRGIWAMRHLTNCHHLGAADCLLPWPPLASGMRGHASRRPLEITEPLSPSEGLLDFNGEARASHRGMSRVLGKWLRFPSLGPNSLIWCTQPENLPITWSVHV